VDKFFGGGLQRAGETWECRGETEHPGWGRGVRGQLRLSGRL